MTFDANLIIHLLWRDLRLDFNNLKHNGNIMNEFWQNQIWIPNVHIGKTQGLTSISMSEDVTIQILRQDRN